MRTLLAVTLALTVATATLTAAPAVRAQAARDAVLTQLGKDVSTVTVNLPIWLSRHLPAMMPQTGLGAGIDYDRDSGGSFALGLILARVGVMNQFSQIGRGTSLMELDDRLPGNVPWPQFGAVVGVGLGAGFQIGLDLQFVPKLDVAVGSNVNVSVATFAASLALRWRINEPDGALPSFILGVGASHYRGLMEVGAGFEERYSYDTAAGPAEGTYTFDGAPRVTWELWQPNVEFKIGWRLGPIRPFLGLGVGMTFGESTARAALRATATIDTIDGQPVGDNPVFYENRQIDFSAPAAKWLFRPHVGLDIVMGIAAFTLQLDLAVMNQDRVAAGLPEAAAGYTAVDNPLYNEASQDSSTAAALVATLAFRLQFP
jgi:hypothetical protein